MRRRERQNDIVLSRRRLELEIELAAEALAESEPPGAIYAAAIGRVDYKLHAPRLVEEALENERLVRRQRAKRTISRPEIVDDLLGRRAVETKIASDPVEGACGTALVEAVLDV